MEDQGTFQCCSSTCLVSCSVKCWRLRLVSHIVESAVTMTVGSQLKYFVVNYFSVDYIVFALEAKWLPRYGKLRTSIVSVLSCLHVAEDLMNQMLA